MPKVSVVIPNYNHARFLRWRLRTVLDQTYTDFDVLYLDDASTDDSAEVFQEFAHDPRVRSIINTQNSGSAFKQWNRGVAATTGEYIWIAESDDSADPAFLANLVPVLDASPRVGMVHCHLWTVDEEDRALNQPINNWDHLDPHRWKEDFVSPGKEELAFLKLGCHISNASGVLFRRSVYQQVGGVDESYRFCGDWVFWMNVLNASDVGFIAKPLNYFRTHAGSVRRSAGPGADEQVEIERALAHYSTLTRTPLKAVRTAYHDQSARDAMRWGQPDRALWHARRLLGLKPFGLHRWRLWLEAYKASRRQRSPVVV